MATEYDVTITMQVPDHLDPDMVSNVIMKLINEYDWENNSDIYFDLEETTLVDMVKDVLNKDLMLSFDKTGEKVEVAVVGTNVNYGKNVSADFTEEELIETIKQIIKKCKLK